MRDKDWGGDWVIGELKTASLTGSNFPGMVDGAECRADGGGPRERRGDLRWVARTGWSFDSRMVQPRRGRIRRSSPLTAGRERRR